MKALKTVAFLGATSLALGGGIYLMNNRKLRKKTAKSLIKAMDSAEDVIAKKMY